MVFRRDKQGGDAFQRQISALRQQLGSGAEEEDFEDQEPERGDFGPEAYSSSGYEQPDYGYDDAQTAIEEYEPQAPPVIPVADAQMTVISNDTTWKGEVASEGSMHVHGRYEGVIRAREDVFILEEATVSAEVHARNVVVAGRYDGDVTCEARFEVLPTGKVEGAVRAPVLVVHDGAELNGSIQMTNLESSRQAPTSLVHRREASGSGQG